MMKSLLTTIGIAILCTASAFAGQQIGEITHSELKTAIKQKDAVILDVNGTDSFANGHIPTAIDYFVVKDKLATALPADKSALIVAYCGSVHCPAYKAAADAAIKLGYTNVKHYAPGLAGWQENKEPLVKN